MCDYEGVCMSVGQIEKMCLSYQRVVSHLSAWPDCPVGAGLFKLYFWLMCPGGKVWFGPAHCPVDFLYKMLKIVLRNRCLAVMLKRVFNSELAALPKCAATLGSMLFAS